MPKLTAARILAVVAVALPLAAVGCQDDGPPVKLSAQGKLGATVARTNNCSACHSSNGDELTGPTWKGLYGKKITLSTGKRITVDDAYIERSVREPNAQREQDATGQMPTFDEDRISDEQLRQLIAYIKDLR